MSKTVLAIDTALGGISVGVISAAGKSAMRQVETQRDQAAMLVPLIQETLEEVGVPFKDLELIAATIGPGSFTGLRIGLSTARTLSMALSIPVSGVNTLELLATHYDTVKPLLVLLETKRKDFYAGTFDTDGTVLLNPFAADATTILEQIPVDDFVIGGDCLERFSKEAGRDLDYLEEIRLPDPLKLAVQGLKQFEEKGDQGKPEPLYLRGADVSQPKTPPRKLEA